MKIAAYIGDLLYDYECVVIPGLGGFLSRDYPASIHPVKHYFSPPHREIVFNPWLRANDGLLLNHIALNEKLPYHEAKSRIDRFVLKCLSALAEGKRINFRNVGTIYLDKDQQMVFEPDKQHNYLPDAFGLSGFVSPPIKRDEKSFPKEPIFSRPARQAPDLPPPVAATTPRTSQKRPMVASRRPSGLRRQLVIIGTAAAALLAGAAYMNKNIVSSYYHQFVGQASVLPLFYASPGEYLLMHMDKLPKDMILMGKELPSSKQEQTKVKRAADDLRPADAYRPQTDEAVQAEPEIQSNEESNEVTVNMGYLGTLQEMVVGNDSRTNKPEKLVEPVEGTQANSEDKPLAKFETTSPTADVPRGFYIVAGAFRDKANADKLVNQLKQRHFDATIAGRTSNGLWRVTYERLDNRASALSRLSEIKQTVDSQAWLLVI